VGVEGEHQVRQVAAGMCAGQGRQDTGTVSGGGNSRRVSIRVVHA
jgi:hypothetical protein